MLIKAMRKYGCKKIVFSSSATVYGPVNKAPYTEDMPTSATNPYGYTKVMIEQILRDVYVSDNDWSVSLLRYFNLSAHIRAVLLAKTLTVYQTICFLTSVR